MIILEFLLATGVLAIIVIAIYTGYKIGKGRDGTSDSAK